ncbi:MAG: hypothetical protein CME26_13475 [Gemmatimonadetes bacterium]|nr:hypothetical protein [Gemmatimonadota bacterium]
MDSDGARQYDGRARALSWGGSVTVRAKVSLGLNEMDRRISFIARKRYRPSEHQTRQFRARKGRKQGTF